MAKGLGISLLKSEENPHRPPSLLDLTLRPHSFVTDVNVSGHDLPDCDIESIIIGRQIYATFFTFAYVIPLAAVMLLYLGILRHVAAARRRGDGSIGGRNSPSRRATSSVGQSTATLIGRRQSSSAQRRRQLGRLLMLVVILFAALWLPIHVHLLLAYFGTIPDSRAYEVVSVLWNSLAYVNSCVNPFVYNYTSKEFRDAFRRHTTGLLFPRREGREANEEERGGCRVWRRKRKHQRTLSTTCNRVNANHLVHGRDRHMESNVDRICKEVNRKCSFDDLRTCTKHVFESSTVNPAGGIMLDPVGSSSGNC